MAIRDITYLKSKFQTYDVPTEQDYIDLFDTMFSLTGSDFDPENILTDLKFNNTTGSRKLSRDIVAGSVTYKNYIEYFDYLIELYSEAKVTGSGDDIAKSLIRLCSYPGIDGLSLQYEDVDGSNKINIKGSQTFIDKKLTLTTDPGSLDALDLIHKGFLEDKLLSTLTKLEPDRSSLVNIDIPSLTIGSSIDGRVIVTGTYFLFNQTTPSENGLYAWVGGAFTKQVIGEDTLFDYIRLLIIPKEGANAGKLFTVKSYTVGPYVYIYWQVGGGNISQATNSVLGLVKLYTDLLASNTDGSVTQAAIVAALATKAMLNRQFSTTQTGTAYTLALANANTILRQSNASAITTTVPANSTVPFDIGTEIEIRQSGLGAITLTPAVGVTLNAVNGILATAGQYDTIKLIKQATDSWQIHITPASFWGGIGKNYIDTQDKKFAVNVEFINGTVQASVYFETAATISYNKRESTISTLSYSTNGGSSFSAITAGVVSLSIPADTWVIFQITYVTPTSTSKGGIYLKATY